MSPTSSDPRAAGLLKQWRRLVARKSEEQGRSMRFVEADEGLGWLRDELDWQFRWEDLETLARENSWSEISRPLFVGRFLRTFVERVAVDSILDPYASSPSILGIVSEASTVRRALGLATGPAVPEVAADIDPSIDWLVGNIPLPIERSQENFDWLVSSPPLGLLTDDREAAAAPPGLRPSAYRRNRELLVLALAARFAKRGMAVLLSEQVLWARATEPWLAYVADQGLHFTSAISVVDGLAPATRITTVMCFFSREPEEQLFVGRLTHASDPEPLVDNLVARRPGTIPELGALVDHGRFKGWIQFAARLELQSDLRRSRVPLESLADLIMEVADGLAEPGSQAPGASNSIYFDARVLRAVTTSPPESAGKTPVPYFEVQLDPDRASADFVASWLNGPHGKLMLQSLAVGTAQQRLQRDALGLVEIPLPNIGAQTTSVALHRKLSTMGEEMNELHLRLWRAPWTARDLEDELGELMHEDPLRAWGERLPFPLASILISYMADASAEKKVERLLHFFEAFAEFGVVILLSALRRNSDMWEREKPRLREPGPTGRHPLAQGQFGGWTSLGQHLAKAFRTRLNDVKEADGRRGVFGVADLEFAAVLTGKELWNKLDEARVVRNSRGHGGRWSSAEVQRRLERLETLVAEIQQITSRAFNRVVLVQPGDGARSQGLRRYEKARRLTGPLGTFFEKPMVALANVDVNADSLCFVDRGETVEDALELLPFVRLLPSPETEQNAIYFFNELSASGGFRFVSYHLPGEAEAPLDDPGLSMVVAELLSQP